MLAGDQMRGDDVHLRFQGFEFVIAADHLAPDLAVERGQRIGGRAFQQQFAIGDDGHARAKLANVVDDVSGKNDRDFAADGAEQIQKAIALGGIQSGGGLVDDDQPGIGEQCLRNAEALLHAAGIRAERLFAHLPQIGLLQQRIHHLLALSRRGNALHHRQMFQHVERGDLGIHAELLRQIAEDLADFVFLRQHVETIDVDGSRSRDPEEWRPCASGCSCRRHWVRAAQTCCCRW